MSDILILGILKFLALGVALASAIWGMTQRIAIDDPDGRKRLTSAGRVAVWLAIGSFAVSGGSYWFEVAAKQKRDDLAAIDERAAREARQEDERQREQRILQPIDHIFAQVTWEMRPDSPGVSTATARLAALARSIRADRSVANGLPGLTLGGNDLAIVPASEFYPTAERDGALAGAVRSPDARVSIFARGESARTGLANITRGPPRSVSILGEAGDLRFRLTAPERPTLYYNIETGILWFEAKLAAHATIDRSGALLSVPDLENGMLAIDWSDRARPTAGAAEEIRALRKTMRVTRLRLRVSGRTYDLLPPRLRMIPSGTGFPLFVADPVGPPQR
jgi:hypothetical protein